jgi:acyl CoA:acetate/3-ketoacid CoA transferase beta subunit
MRTSTAQYSGIDMICVCIAREIKDGDLAGQGISTPMVGAAYMLAKLTHARHSIISYTVGNLLSIDFFPLSILYYEESVIDHCLRPWTFTGVVSDLVPFGCIDVEAFRPAQIDKYGNTNNIVIGDYMRPKVRLPGCGGISDATSIWDRIYFYIPNHNRQVFVEELDFRSGLGFLDGQNDKQRQSLGLLGKGPVKTFSNLGVMDFDEETRRMRLVSLHPDVTLDEIKENTSFELIIPREIKETAPPSQEEIDLLNERIDPYGIRVLESLSGQKRNQKIKEIIEREMNARQKTKSPRHARNYARLPLAF